jgi:hypothetical protein
MRNFFALIVALFVLNASSSINAQVSFGISFNLNSQPAWGPTGYDYVENYYFPDIEVYYNIPTHRYYYNDGNRWRYSSRMPSRYRNFDLYNSHKEVVNDKSPWRNHNSYRDKYSSYKGQHDQQPIRDSRDSKYFANRYHPEHNNWVKQQKHDNGNHNGGNNDKNRQGNKQNNRNYGKNKR